MAVTIDQPASLPEPPPDALGPSRKPRVENKPFSQALARHRRKCQVCRHPEREQIEQEYRDWFRPTQISRRYNIDDSALHRHFHAVGLISARRQNLRYVVERIIEQGAEEPISGDTIIRAVRAMCCLQDDNTWVEPVRNVVYQREEPQHEEVLDPISNRESAD
jgi:hypothetical protein